MSHSGEAMWLLDFAAVRVDVGQPLCFRYYDADHLCLAQSPAFHPHPVADHKTTGLVDRPGPNYTGIEIQLILRPGLMSCLWLLTAKDNMDSKNP